MELKLNNKRTILVGLAFLSISAFWQMYDSVMTLILAGTFQLNETVSGAIMAADNVLALFLLPLFGAISDRTETRIGRRMPFILGGTAAAVMRPSSRFKNQLLNRCCSRYMLSCGYCPATR